MTVDGATAPVYLNGIDLAGQGGIPRGLVTNKYGTIQPRIGFSEDVFGNGRTVVRGGFGTFFERMQGNLIYNSATVSPFSFDPSANNVYFSDPHTSNSDRRRQQLRHSSREANTNMAQNFPDPAVAMYSLGVQHELSPSVVAVVQYVGNVAWHQENQARQQFPADHRPCSPGRRRQSHDDAYREGKLVTLPTQGQGNTSTTLSLSEPTRATPTSRPWKPTPMGTTTVCRPAFAFRTAGASAAKWTTHGRMRLTFRAETTAAA